MTQLEAKREKFDKQKRRCQWHSRRDGGSLTGSIKSDEGRTRPPELATRMGRESRMIHDRDAGGLEERGTVSN